MAFRGGKPVFQPAKAAPNPPKKVALGDEAKRGLVLLPRRWVVERSFARMARFQRLAKDYERLPTTLAGLHLVVFARLMLSNLRGGSP